MRHIHFYGDAGYYGTDYHIFDVFPAETPDEFLEATAADYARDNADGYEYLDTGWDNDFEDEDAREAYYENVTGYWEEVTPQEYEKLMEEYGICG